MCAAPVAAVVCFSPAQAATVNFSDFVGAFAPTNWSFTGNGGYSFTPTPGTTVPLTRMNLTSADGGPVTLKFNTNTLNSFAPTSTTPGKVFVFDYGNVTQANTSTSNLDYIITTVDKEFVSFTLQPDLIAPVPGSQGRVSGFAYLANYKEVPGPLPVAAAVGAFAWSRRIRRRLGATSQA